MSGKETDNSNTDDGDCTGLPWPKSWRGAYIVVLASFALWLALLIALTELFA